MFEKQMILTRDFQNVRKGGQIVGFQLLLKTAYYRGTFLDIIGDIDVAVDGVKYKRDQLRITVEGRTFTLDEAGKVEDVHWDFGTPLILTVMAPGGLKPGLRDVTVTLGMNPSYVPKGLFKTTEQKRMTLVM
ncbi:MAG TPA: DUF6379 domain-containing protein [Steroidobacteraceae bacterium]|jgi:hypothetical protein